jgi:hypothetical protein
MLINWFPRSQTVVRVIVFITVGLLLLSDYGGLSYETSYSTGKHVPSQGFLQKQSIVAQATGNGNGYPALYFPLIMRPPIDLKIFITKTTITLPHLLFGTCSSYCTWGGCGLGPRLYHEPLPNGSTLLGWSDLDTSDLSSDGHVSVIVEEVVEQTFDFEGRPVRGLAAHPDGSFAVLLWDQEADIMYLSK